MGLGRPGFSVAPGRGARAGRARQCADRGRHPARGHRRADPSDHRPAGLRARAGGPRDTDLPDRGAWVLVAPAGGRSAGLPASPGQSARRGGAADVAGVAADRRVGRRTGEAGGRRAGAGTSAVAGGGRAADRVRGMVLGRARSGCTPQRGRTDRPGARANRLRPGRAGDARRAAAAGQRAQADASGARTAGSRSARFPGLGRSPGQRVVGARERGSGRGRGRRRGAADDHSPGQGARVRRRVRRRPRPRAAMVGRPAAGGARRSIRSPAGRARDDPGGPRARLPRPGRGGRRGRRSGGAAAVLRRHDPRA